MATTSSHAIRRTHHMPTKSEAPSPTTYAAPKADADMQKLWETAKKKLLARFSPHDVKHAMFRNIQLQDMTVSKMVLSVSQPHLKRWAEADEQMAVIRPLCDEINPDLMTLQIVLRTAARAEPVFDPEEELRNRTPIDPPVKKHVTKGVKSRVTLPADRVSFVPPTPVVSGETYHQRNARMALERSQGLPTRALAPAPEAVAEPVAKPAAKPKAARKPRKPTLQEEPVTGSEQVASAVLNPPADADGSTPLTPAKPKPRGKHGPAQAATAAQTEPVTLDANSPLAALLVCACTYLKLDYDEVMVGQPTVDATRVKQMAAYIGHTLLGTDMKELSRLLGGIAEDKVRELLDEVGHAQQDDLKLHADIDQIGYLYIEQQDGKA